MASHLASAAGSSAGTIAGLASAARASAGASSSSSSAAWASPLLTNLQELIASASSTFNKLPGSAIILRYIASSYQDDPIRSLLELFLFVFAVRTVLQSRTRGGSSGSNFVKLSDKEINELVSEFHPEPLCAPLNEQEIADLNSVPIVIGGASSKPKVSLASHQNGKPITCTNLASYNFANLADDERIKERAIATLRSYGVGSCSPPGFYGTIDVHMALEADIARFIGHQSAIIYSQGFSTISSVIPAFSKRGDIIIADRGVSFAIQKGIQISRSTVRWYDHNNLQSLEDALEAVRRDDKRRRGPLTRRFIVTEGIFEGDGAKTDLVKVVELKKKYKFRLILDESISFGTVGATGRGMTELCQVPAKEVEILVGSMANTLGAAGGFCAGSDEVVFHQRINGTAFVFSAALPAMLAVASSTAIGNLISNPLTLTTLQDNVKILRTVLDSIESLYIPSDLTSPLIHFQIRSKLEKHPETSQEKFERSLNGGSEKNSSLMVPSNSGNKASVKGDGNHDLSPEEQKALLQKIIDDALSNGVLLVLHKKLPSINPPLLDVGTHCRPSIRIAVSAAFTKKEMEKASNVVKNSVVKVLGKRR